MAKQSKRPRLRKKQTAKTPRKIINWAEYNQALVNRGNFTFWISDDVLAQWRHENNNLKVGRPFTYSLVNTKIWDTGYLVLSLRFRS